MRVILVREASMQRFQLGAVCAPLWAALLGCTASPSAPSSFLPPPTAKFAGNYALTIEIDEKCAEFPESLRVWAYRAVLEDHGYLSLQVLGKGFNEPIVVGQLYVQDDSRFRFLLNFNYEELDHYPDSPRLLLYGSGDAAGTDSNMYGVILGNASLTGLVRGVGCAGSHRFTFVRQASQALRFGHPA
jgi:hypothetical protein